MITITPEEYLPRQLTFITTDNCNAKCAHCIMCCSPGAHHSLTFAQMQKFVDDIISINPLELVVFSGGEPTLLGEDLFNIIAYCSSLGILTRIVTNAFWAKTRESARSMIRTLRECGLNEINYSCDDYHLPFIPFSYIKNAWIESKNVGFSAVVIANSYGNGDTVNPDFIMEQIGERIPLRYDNQGLQSDLPMTATDGTLYILSNTTLQRIGRAKDTINDSKFRLVDDETMIKGGCPWLICQPAISPTGHLWTCCGLQSDGNQILDLGYIENKNLSKILDTAGDHIFINALRYLGPMFLRNRLMEWNPSLSFRKNYGSNCEVCQDITENPAVLPTLRLHCLELAQYITLMQEKLATEQQKHIQNNESIN